MAGLRCAVVILPCENGDLIRAERLVRDAGRQGRGDFRQVDLLPFAATSDTGPAMREAASSATSGGYDWLLVLTAAETAAPDLFVQASPALRIADAVWGGASVAGPGGAPQYERITRLAAQDDASFFHLALRWWIGPSHFVRPAAALAALGDASDDAADADYLLGLWRHRRCLKLSHALTVFHGELPPVPGPLRGRLLEALDTQPVFNEVGWGGGSVCLPYTGRNPVIERDHTRGQFFEQRELDYLRGRFPAGMRIVDAGANTGNHTVYFAAAMAARSILPIEPDPRACEAIRIAVARNRLENVDMRCLGMAVGEAEGRMRPLWSEGGGLGATRLVADAAGMIPVRTLDSLAEEPIDLLKIDVEGMEMAVLAGAAQLLSRCRPAIFVEVVDETVPEFLQWLDSNRYRIEKLFPDKTHSNYLVCPIEYPG